MAADIDLKSSQKNDLQDPLFSVIITNFNYGSFLRQAMDSVLQQTYRNFELIVVDDGSSDDSLAIIDSYGDVVAKVAQKNSGMSAARNAGFDRSSGQLVSFLDADDFYHPERLATIVQAFETHPEWTMLSHLWLTVDRNGQIVGQSTSNILSTGDVRPLLLKWGKYASGITSSLAFRRSALEKVMPVSGNMGIDSYVNATLPFYGEIGGINEPLMFYRIHGNNARARSTDLSRLIGQREAIASFINQAAECQGLRERFDLGNDADYQAYKNIERDTASLACAARMLWLSIRESIAIRRSRRDFIIRLMTRLSCAFPAQGRAVLEHGLRGYLRLKLDRNR
ncbi:glycosyltransferase [Acaryochloris sp. IP29b_bin.137]|uniref:glycosyltransferase family 2 protein n=1 Tax=Acaryochloris sp. IP29b_bin.137 TaxID=2969217 RepID=UPI00261CD8E0|nr:glycosyltransferase [Acaryochloris sp. IP29b_bin.137]